MKELKVLILTGVIITCFLSGVPTWGAGETELEGEWISTVPGQDMVFTFSEKKFSIKSPSVQNYWYQGTFTLNTKTDPKRVDLAIKEGGIPQYINRTSLGIYKIENSALTLALKQPGAPDYPPSFETTSGAIVFKLKKK